MAKIAYLLLCHKDPDAIIRQAALLTAGGDYVAIHFDANGSARHNARIRKALAGNDHVTFVARRIRCGWGTWSLVRATLATIKVAVDAFPQATHFYMISGDCMATKTAEYMHQFLDEADADYIENKDYFQSDWIKTGMKEERLIYWHYFNERKNKKLFYGAMALQKKLGLTRSPPPDLDMRIGSQWWCLRRRTIEEILAFLRRRSDIKRFFSTTWIPDETFFQTLVPHLVPADEICDRTLTFLMFTDYGMPLTFYNDHFDMLVAQEGFFARKISPDAHDLKARLGALYTARDVSFTLSNEGPGLFKFLTGRGRVGRRFAPRFWESEATLGRDRELLVVVCKKWHVAKRLQEQVGQITDLPAVAYLFNEEDTALPDLGGIQSPLEKRTRHRRALLRMVFDYFQSDRLMICLDPSSFELLEDFVTDRSVTRILDVQCQFTDEDLKGHARRVGLAGEQTSPETFKRLLPTIHSDMAFESDRICDAGFDNYHRLNEAADPTDNAQALMHFLSIPWATALDIATSDGLFSD